jgi:hypothetical protein
MDASVISALSAVMGSLVGGSASIATAWFTQRTQGRRERINAEILKRETLYAEFISECSKLIVDSLDHTLDNPETIVQVYAVRNRIRLRSSDAVSEAAADVIKHIMERYFGPKLTPEQLREYALSISDEQDPMKGFAEACREELARLKL